MKFLREKKNNSSSAESKFSPNPHPFFRLSPSALPPGTPNIVLEQARAAFSCSISKNTQQNYATSVRHLKDAELAMGRNFSLPMTSQERAFFVAYMMGKGVKKDTINGYLSALRHYELALGRKCILFKYFKFSINIPPHKGGNQHLMACLSRALLDFLP